MRADALGVPAALPDASLGGIIATQVVEHLEPSYLMRLLDAAARKLRPGAPIVLETINPACWLAFFSSYIRDLTHVRPVHPETLQYLLRASGFERVDDPLQRAGPRSREDEDDRSAGRCARVVRPDRRSRSRDSRTR